MSHFIFDANRVILTGASDLKRFVGGVRDSQIGLDCTWVRQWLVVLLTPSYYINLRLTKNTPWFFLSTVLWVWRMIAIFAQWVTWFVIGRGASISTRKWRELRFKISSLSGIILSSGSAYERRGCIVTSSLMGWTETQNDLCLSNNIKTGWASVFFSQEVILKQSTIQPVVYVTSNQMNGMPPSSH